MDAIPNCWNTITSGRHHRRHDRRGRGPCLHHHLHGHRLLLACRRPRPASTTTAGPPATTTEAATRSSSTSAAWPPASSTTTFTGWPGFVDHNVAAHEIMAVQSLHGAVGFLVAIDLNKSEPARLARKTVAHQGNIRPGDSRLSK